MSPDATGSRAGSGPGGDASVQDCPDLCSPELLSPPGLLRSEGPTPTPWPQGWGNRREPVGLPAEGRWEIGSGGQPVLRFRGLAHPVTLDLPSRELGLISRDGASGH